MIANLQALFSRSSYISLSLRFGAHEPRQIRQAERFLTAVTGFCIRNDIAFARGFIGAVTGQVPDTLSGMFVQAEPRREADLLIVIPERLVVVVEFKIHARIQPHQKYDDDAFSYGDWLVATYGKQVGQIRYTILDQNGGRPDLHDKRVSYMNAAWRQIRDLRWLNATLRDDYFDLCKNLGIAGMSSERLMKKKMKGPLLPGIDLLRILEAVREHVGATGVGKYFYLDWPMGESGSYLGYAINAIDGDKTHRNSYQRKLAPRCGKPKLYLAWIGYEQKVGAKYPTACVYFQADEKIKQSKLKSLMLKKGFGAQTEIELQIKLERPGSDAGGDADWFVKVLEAPL